MEITIPILSGSYFDLSKFDFSFKNIRIMNISSKEFEDYIESQQPDFKASNMIFFEEIKEIINLEYDQKYAIVYNDPKKEFNYQDLLNVWKFLLIIFPSDLQIEHEVHFDFEDNFFQRSHMTSWNKQITGEYPGEPLFAMEEDVMEINNYAKIVFNRLNLSNYIGIAIENYITSYSASHMHYQYLTLCIALESIIFGNQELTYRLRRTVAILCGKDEWNCKNIFDNLNKLYSLRSKIIHGEDYRLDKVLEYMTPLRAIVSRTIIELLLHNITKNEQLNQRITEIGFGDRQKISENWQHFQLNISTMVESNWKKLE